MSSGRSLPQSNLCVQGGIQGDSHIFDRTSIPVGIAISVYRDTKYRYFEPFAQFCNTGNAPHTITPAVLAVCHSKAKAGLRRSPRGLYTRIRLSSLLRLNLDSSLKTNWLHSAVVQFLGIQHHSKQRRRWVGVKSNTRNGRRDPICSSARRLRMFRKDTGVPNEGATCAWMAADDAVGYTRVFLTMWG
ncbi:uncharacterized protein TNCV_345891 [Trichonephila clavipes]|nr:uncharacterized protein TNCV_345891 [Trichonephila clavipes]